MGLRPTWRAVWWLALGILLGLALAAGSLLAASNRPMQDVLNIVLDETFRGFRWAPSVPKSGVLHNAATATGTSSAVRADGFRDKSIGLTSLTGTATVAVEWRLEGSVWKAIDGCTMTNAGDKCDMAGAPVYELRTNITACDSCTVTTRYHFEP